MCWEWGGEGHDLLATRSVFSIFAAALIHSPIQLHVRLPTNRTIFRLRGIEETSLEAGQNRGQSGGEKGRGVQPVDSMVRPEGLEPPTPRSVVWCSIH